MQTEILTSTSVLIPTSVAEYLKQPLPTPPLQGPTDLPLLNPLPPLVALFQPPTQSVLANAQVTPA